MNIHQRKDQPITNMELFLAGCVQNWYVSLDVLCEGLCNHKGDIYGDKETPVAVSACCVFYVYVSLDVLDGGLCNHKGDTYVV